MLPFRYRTTFYDHIDEPSIVNSSDSCPYELLAEHLTRAGITVSPSDAHGFACGLIVLAVPDGLLTWERELLAEADASDDVAIDPASHAFFQQQFQQSEKALLASDYSLVLCLPDDDVVMKARVVALSDWCRGFLFAMGFAAGSRLDALSKEAREAIADLTEITRLDAVAAADSEQDTGGENALMELQEYVRVAIYLVKQELQSAAGEVE